MSYEIIYNTFTVKKNGVYIPMVVIGSNNCWEYGFRGRARRERNLHKAKFFFNGKEVFHQIDDMNKHFDFKSIQREMEWGSLQGKYKTDKGILTSFKKYVVDNKNVPTYPLLVSLYYSKLTEKEKDKIWSVFTVLDGIKGVLTKKEEEKIINKCLNKLNENIKNKLLDYSGKNLIRYSCNRKVEKL
jgi:hypothetical protein